MRTIRMLSNYVVVVACMAMIFSALYHVYDEMMSDSPRLMVPILMFVLIIFALVLFNLVHKEIIRDKDKKDKELLS